MQQVVEILKKGAAEADHQVWNVNACECTEIESNIFSWESENAAEIVVPRRWSWSRSE
jgi:hypothetical protein